MSDKPKKPKTKKPNARDIASLLQSLEHNEENLPEEVREQLQALRGDAATPPAPQAVKTFQQDQLALRRKVEMFYDIQRVRIQTGGRVVGRTVETKGDKTGTPNPIVLAPEDMKSLELRLAELQMYEEHAFKDVVDHLNTIPFYVEVLSDKVTYRGLGATMAAVILSSFDIYREDTVSKMWSFAGLKPLPARRCKQCHTVVVEERDGSAVLGWTHGKGMYVENCALRRAALPEEMTYLSGKSQRPEAGKKLPYNAWLRTKLIGVLAGCLIKSGSLWRKFYDDYKHRLQSEKRGTSDGHRDAMAKRYMVKMLLVDIHKKWRTHLGLPVRGTYQEEYLNHRHDAATPKPEAKPPTERGMTDYNAMMIEEEMRRLER